MGNLAGNRAASSLEFDIDAWNAAGEVPVDKNE